jgi:hypothetical protein
LKSPFPIYGYDVRGILYTDNDGHELRNPDNWTGLFDIPGGESINPFKAYAKDNINRMFSCPEFEHYLIYIPQPPKYETIRYAADVSYPGNCKEPYEIVNFHQDDILSSTGSSGNVFIDVHDWQNDANKVSMQAPGLTGDNWVDFTHLTGDTWGLLLSNDTSVGAGYYQATIKATSSGSGTLALYVKVTITISSAPSEGWARTWGGGNSDRGYSVAVDASANIYTVGMFEWTVDFDPGPGVDLHTSNAEATALDGAFLSKFDSSGNFQWARTWGGLGCGNAADAYGVAINDSGDVFVTGIFWGTVDFDPGSGVEEHTAIGEQDMFLSKFDASGNFQWTRVWGGEGTDESWGIAVDKSGNIIITGRFGFSVDFDPGPGVDNHEGDANDDFITKFNPSGDFQWARTWGSKNNSAFDMSYAIAVDGSENIYVAGIFGNKADFDPGTGVDEHTSVGGTDIFIAKFNSSGVFQWARTWGGANEDYGQGVAVDGLGKLYVTGWFRYLADFNPGPGVDEHSSDVENELFLSKFDTSGNFIWACTWNGSAGEDGQGVAVDGVGNPYIIGYFGGSLDLDPGPGIEEYITNACGAFLCKFNPEGEFQWGREWGGNYACNDESMPFAVAVDNAGYAFVTGDYIGTIDFDPSPGIDEHFGNWIIDVFLLKFNPNGEW